MPTVIQYTVLVVGRMFPRSSMAAFAIVAAIFFFSNVIIIGNGVVAAERILALGETAILNCNGSEQAEDQRLLDNETSPTFWMLPFPGLRMINMSEEKYILSNRHWTLQVLNTTVDDLGQYYCMFQNESNMDQWFLVQVGLNLRGPYFVNNWSKYEMPTIIAFSACFGFLLLVALIVILYYFRYIPPAEESEQLTASSGGTDVPGAQSFSAIKSPGDQFETNGYSNLGLEPEPTESEISTDNKPPTSEDSKNVENDDAAPEYTEVQRKGEVDNQYETEMVTVVDKINKNDADGHSVADSEEDSATAL